MSTKKLFLLSEFRTRLHREIVPKDSIRIFPTPFTNNAEYIPNRFNRLNKVFSPSLLLSVSSFHLLGKLTIASYPKAPLLGWRLHLYPSYGQTTARPGVRATRAFAIFKSWRD